MKRALLATAMIFAGCSHVELEYRGDLELEDGRDGTVIYNASYATGGHQIACILTGIFYGGWCWAYLAMPMDDQDREIERDAEGFIAKRFDGKAEITYGRASRVSWDTRRPRAKVKVLGEPAPAKTEEKSAEPAAAAAAAAAVPAKPEPAPASKTPPVEAAPTPPKTTPPSDTDDGEEVKDVEDAPESDDDSTRW